MNTLCWLTDLHLEKVSQGRRNALYSQLTQRPEETFLITGDISDSAHLPLHLRELAAATAPRTVYFVLGNHDFYGSSFAKVEGIVAGVCRACPNLRHLGGGEMIALSSDTALIGHRGWYDGRMGWGKHSQVRNPDFEAIEDFQGMRPITAFGVLRELGRESATYFRKLLPLALTAYKHVIIATHVPPFTKAACFDSRPCGYDWQPFFTNISAGATILRITEKFPDRRVTVLCGHAHCESEVSMSQNLSVLTGGCRTGYPSIQRRVPRLQ